MYIVRLKNKARGMVQVSKSYADILQTEYNQKFDDKVIKIMSELYDYNTVEDLGNEHRVYRHKAENDGNELLQIRRDGDKL
jgi:hypothetical protein